MNNSIYNTPSQVKEEQSTFYPMHAMLGDFFTTSENGRSSELQVPLQSKKPKLKSDWPEPPPLFRSIIEANNRIAEQREAPDYTEKKRQLKKHLKIRVRNRQAEDAPKLLWCVGGEETYASQPPSGNGYLSSQLNIGCYDSGTYSQSKQETPTNIEEACELAAVEFDILKDVADAFIVRLKESLSETQSNLNRIRLTNVKKEVKNESTFVKMEVVDDDYNKRLNIDKLRNHIHVLKSMLEATLLTSVKKAPKLEHFQQVTDVEAKITPALVSSQKGAPLNNLGSYARHQNNNLNYDMVALEQVDRGRVDVFRITGEETDQYQLTLLKSFSNKPYLLVSHDTRLIVDTDVYDTCPITGDFIKTTTFEPEVVSGAVGLTQNRLLVTHPYYAKCSLYRWCCIEKVYNLLTRAKLSQHREISISNMKLNLFSTKSKKEVYGVYSQEHIFRFDLDERNLQGTKRYAIFRMRRERCIDFKLVDESHIVILYTLSLVVMNVKTCSKTDRVPINLIKFDCEQTSLFLLPNFDIDNYPFIMAKICEEGVGQMYQIIDIRTKFRNNQNKQGILISGLDGVTPLFQLRRRKLPAINCEDNLNEQIQEQVQYSRDEPLKIIADVQSRIGSQLSLLQLFIY